MAPFLLLIACQACSSCLVFNPPDIETEEDTDEETEDTDNQESTVDSPEDTTPPPPCPQPEEEPNNNSGDAFGIEMEEWACGTFESAFDFDVYTFTMDEDGWLEFDIDSASRGSSAQVIVSLEDEEGETVAALRSDTDTDARILIPAQAGTWEAWLNEWDMEYGEDVDYHLLATVTKRPVSWNVDSEALETPNNLPEDAYELVSGDHVWGVIDSASSFDWYVWRTPADGKKRTLNVRVTAMSEGSPLNPRLQRYRPHDDLVVMSQPSETWNGDDDSASQDPSVEIVADYEDVYLKVRHLPQTQTGAYYWYVLSIEVDE